MKKNNQIERRDNSAVSILQREAPTRRVKVRLSQKGKAAIETAASKRGLTKSQLAERAIERELSQHAGKGRGAKPSRPLVRQTAPKITTRGVCGPIAGDWSEVASIDFAGYVDRDCEERIIYKTPEGALKAAKSFAEGGTVIEDVTREQVVRWILECVIPEEFEPDFRRVLPNVAAKGGAN